jgi:hypothetical protein
MKLGIVFMLFILVQNGPVWAQQKFDKANFYSVMKSGDIDAIDKELDNLKDASIKERTGYEGALLMKKAGLVKKPKQRLSMFKAGRIKLETALSQDNDNTELHFLRLIIEEHAPKIVKYHSDIEADKLLIQKDFKSLAPAVQHAVLDYCKSSKVLHKEDL